MNASTNGVMVSTKAARMQKATSTFIPVPCSNSLHAPAHLTGSPRLIQKSWSFSVNRAHWVDRVSMYQSQGEEVTKNITSNGKFPFESLIMAVPFPPRCFLGNALGRSLCSSIQMPRTIKP